MCVREVQVAVPRGHVRAKDGAVPTRPIVDVIQGTPSCPGHGLQIYLTEDGQGSWVDFDVHDRVPALREQPRLLAQCDIADEPATVGLERHSPSDDRGRRENQVVRVGREERDGELVQHDLDRGVESDVREGVRGDVELLEVGREVHLHVVAHTPRLAAVRVGVGEVGRGEEESAALPRVGVGERGDGDVVEERRVVCARGHLVLDARRVGRSARDEDRAAGAAAGVQDVVCVGVGDGEGVRRGGDVRCRGATEGCAEEWRALRD
jgi:hypothetical protein